MQYHNMTSSGEDDPCLSQWHQKEAVDLIVTEFRKNPAYIKVRY